MPMVSDEKNTLKIYLPPPSLRRATYTENKYPEVNNNIFPNTNKNFPQSIGPGVPVNHVNVPDMKKIAMNGDIRYHNKVNIKYNFCFMVKIFPNNISLE